MKDRNDSGMGRRQFLTSTIVTIPLVLPGCIQQDDEPERFVFVTNNREEMVEFEIKFYRVDPEEKVFFQSLTLDSKESRSYDQIFEESGTKRVIVETADGVRGSYHWETGAEPGSGTLLISIEDEIEFQYGSG